MGKKNKEIIELNTVYKGLRYAVIISLLISAILIIITIDRDAMRKALNSLNPGMVAILFLLLFINWIFAGIQLRILVNATGNDISIKDSIIIFLAGSFISNVTPFATGGGPFQVYFLHKKGVNIGQASMVIVILFILRIFFFGLTSSLFLIFFNWAISPGIIPTYVFYVAFISGLLISTLVILFSLVPGITDIIIGYIFKIKGVKKMFKKSHKAKKLLVKARRELNEFHYSLEVLGKYKGKLILAGLCTLLYWSTLFLIMPFILKGLGLEPNFFKTYVMQTIFYLVIPYMPTPGASGIAEVGFASLFISFIPNNLLGLVTFIWRFLTFYVILFVGGFFALREIGWSENG